MSFYNNPFLTSSPYSAPAYAPSPYTSLDDEEAVALAHLQSIRQRREVAQRQAYRDAAIEQARLQRQAAIEQAQIQRDAAIEQARIQREAAKMVAARQAALVAAQQERAREQAIRQAIAEQRQAERQRYIEHAARKRALQQRAAEEHRRQSLALQREREQVRRAQCANKCCRRAERQYDVHDLLAAMFGLEFATPTAESSEDRPVEKSEKEDKATEAAKQPEEKKQVTIAEPEKCAEKQENNFDKETTSEPQPTQPSSDDHTLDLGDLVSKFLGFNIRPAGEHDQPSQGAEAITSRLNDFLGQFGLEFEPDQPKTSSKGKEVAEGERPNKPVEKPSSAPSPTPTPTPTPAPAAPASTPAAPPAEPAPGPEALDKLRDISQELHLATESFTFPEHLAFASTSSDSTTPPLLFNKSNSAYHAQAHKLLQLLLAADGISSGGDKEVRRQRKAIVKAIEGAIEKLEQRRDQVWEEVKERRERGEESDDEGSVSSWATESSHSEVEHVEHAASVEPQLSEPEVKKAEKEEAVQGNDDEMKGYDVEPSNEAESKDEEKKQVVVEDSRTPVTEEVKIDKDEFELL